ncbi:MAG: FHIPEP family type III secretion protein [Acetatifactor sp.]
MSYDIGEIIRQCRQRKKMTQEEFASRLGVTPQAVSKWERGNGLPDVSLIEGICKVLGINADTLFGITEKVVESGNPMDDAAVKTNLIAEPLVVEFSETLVQLICDGLKTNLVQESRKRLARENGMLLPIIRIRDNCSLEKNAYRVLVYGKEFLSGCADPKDKAFFEMLINAIENYCKEHYIDILNKHIVKILIDNLKSQYPGVADGIIPEQISYRKVEMKLKEKLKSGESIKDLIHIVEELETEEVC